MEAEGETCARAGESSVRRAEVFSRRSVGREASDVVSCEFSDPELLSVKREGDDWRLASLAAFSTEERLSCTFPNGGLFEVDVHIVSVTGPRQSGKSTLVQAAFPDYVYVNLEEPAVRARALVDPTGFVGVPLPRLWDTTLRVFLSCGPRILSIMYTLKL